MTWSDKRISTCMYLSICLKMASKYCNTCVYNELKLLTAHMKNNKNLVLASGRNAC